jgi:phosphohistidine swiveling domain-containing protein
LRGLAALRKAEMQAAGQRPQPPARVILKGAVAAYAPSPAGTAAALSSDISRRGVPCSAGVVRARARVIRDPRVESLAPGEALIASHTDPGWIAVFVNAAAVVAERGSLLSHSAIVARELGIPCVVALKGATDWIRTGDLLEIDGQTGLVSKLDG